MEGAYALVMGNCMKTMEAMVVLVIFLAIMGVVFIHTVDGEITAMIFVGVVVVALMTGTLKGVEEVFPCLLCYTAMLAVNLQ